MALTEEDRAGIDKLDPVSKRNQLVKLCKAQAEDMARNINALEEMGVTCHLEDTVAFRDVVGKGRVSVHHLRFRALLNL